MTYEETKTNREQQRTREREKGGGDVTEFSGFRRRLLGWIVRSQLAQREKEKEANRSKKREREKRNCRHGRTKGRNGRKRGTCDEKRRNKKTQAVDAHGGGLSERERRVQRSREWSQEKERKDEGEGSNEKSQGALRVDGGLREDGRRGRRRAHGRKRSMLTP